ncbi:nucleotidyltransferase domain-containing protein [Candidatus Gottesmanbacteria bacterium]|nr:nucleotidyltransferase domain-containing protein [Candidatus Gottesmanbacteria bacterium]
MKTNTRERIVEYIQAKKHVRVHDLVRHVGLSAVAVHKQLKKLMAQGILEKSGTPPLVLYAFAEKTPSTTNRHVASITQKTAPILHRYGVTKAALFGSAARGQMRPDSDVDILVQMPKNARLLDVLGLQTELEEALARSVDLIQYDLIKPQYRPYILGSQTPIAL